MSERHETADVHMRDTPSVRSYRSTAGPDPFLAVSAEAETAAAHYTTYGGSGAMLKVQGRCTVYLSPEQAEALVTQLTAHLEQMGRAVGVGR